ncbi:replication/maintenance protein RepL [Viridibacillus arvi]|uniref:replication/maintenance protein RepL n=1 Tax=Viridibacillus arvi TaxID=263475 RepID=UPI003D2BCC52
MRNNVKFTEKYDINYEDDNNIAMPNELFTTLLNWKDNKQIKANHIPFTYAYLYYQTYLYRYVKYDVHVPATSEIKLDLGYAQNYKPIDYIIKKDGLLDSEGITISTSDFPVIQEWKDQNRMKYERVKISTLSSLNDEHHNFVHDWKKERNINLKQTIKYPVFAFFRDVTTYDESVVYEDSLYDGTFYFAENTTIIDIRVFEFCMNNKDLGVNGFYLYAYLKNQNYKYNDDFKATRIRMAKETGMSERTVQTYMNALREHNLVKAIYNMECFSLAIKDDRIPNTYVVNEHAEFSTEKVVYEKQLFITRKEHEEKYKEEMKVKESYKCVIGLSALPF